MSLRFIQVVWCIISLFFFHSVSHIHYFIVWVYRNLFNFLLMATWAISSLGINFPVYKWSCCGHFMQVFLLTFAFISLGWIPNSGNSVMFVCLFVLNKELKQFPKWSHHFILPPILQKREFRLFHVLISICCCQTYFFFIIPKDM